MSPLSATHRATSSERGAVEGRVTDAQGVAIEEAAVMIAGDSPTHNDIAALTDTSGGFSFIGLLPGTYTLLVNAAGRPPRQKSVHVEAGRVARLDFVLD